MTMITPTTASLPDMPSDAADLPLPEGVDPEGLVMPDGTAVSVLPASDGTDAEEQLPAKTGGASVGTVALPDEDLYPRLYDQAAMKAAYTFYMANEEAGLEAAAAAAGVPLNTVLRWAWGGKWLEKKGQVLSVRVQDENQRLARFRAARRRDEIQKQVDTGSRLRQKVDDILSEDEREFRPGELKMLGDAAKAAGDLTVRALGVGESGATVEETSEPSGKSGKKQPLVFIFPHGGLPPVRVPGADGAKPAEIIGR